MSAVLLAVVIVAASVVLRPLQKRERERHDAYQRRVGWAYGYGAGYVEGSRGERYDCTPPGDGRTRQPSTSPTEGA